VVRRLAFSCLALDLPDIPEYPIDSAIPFGCLVTVHPSPSKINSSSPSSIMVPTNSNMVLARRVTAGAGASKKAHATTLTPVGFMNNFHLTASSNLNYDTHDSLRAIYRATGDMIFSDIPSFHTPPTSVYPTNCNLPLS
jgi:hypothetical protein